MFTRKAFVASLILFSLSGIAFPGETDYIDMKSVNLLEILPEPPHEGSEQFKKEINEILIFQKTRTDEMIRYAKADQNKDIFRFSTIFGESFSAASLPVTALFFRRTISNGSHLADPVKDFWKRTRPYKADTRVSPCVKIPSGYSYPSSHALAGRLMAVVLSRMVPEKKDAILKRGHEFAENRVIGGVHFRSDIEAGEHAADRIAKALFSNADFLRDFEASKKEVRVFLKYETGDGNIESRKKPAA